jgi:ribonuclease Z
VTLLGTGTPAPNPARMQSALLVEIGDDRLLFDAGRGAVHQMARAGTDIAGVDPVFVTHHHVDHISDLFDVIITTALAGRTGSLRVYGPTGTAGIVRALIDRVYARDIHSRFAEVDSRRRLGLATPDRPEAIADVDPHDVGPGIVCEGDGWRVIADDVLHGDYSHDRDFDWRCLGYRIEAADGKVLAISGDAVPCDGLARLARGADLLVQCCHFFESSITDNAGRYTATHTLPSSGQVGRIAAAAGVGHVVLTHISMHVDEAGKTGELRRDVARDFDGRVTVGEDLMVIEV